MKAYRVPNAPIGERWQRTMSEASAKAKACGDTFGLVDVPDTQQERLDFMNKMELDVAAEAAVETTERLPAPPVSAAPVDTPSITERGRRILREGRELDQVGEWIMTTEGWQLAKLTGAVVERLQQLAREASHE